MRPFLPLQGAICELPAGQKFRSQPSDVVPFSATYAGIGSKLQAGLQPSSALCSSLFSLPPFQGSQALGLNAYKRQGCWMPIAQPPRLRDTQWTCHPGPAPPSGAARWAAGQWLHSAHLLSLDSGQGGFTISSMSTVAEFSLMLHPSRRPGC